METEVSSSSEQQLVKQPTETHLARPLNVLEPLIRKDIEMGENAGIEFFAEAGKKLWEAETHFKSKGALYEWATAKFKRGQGTLRIWMRIAEDRNGGQPPIYERDIQRVRAHAPQSEQSKQSKQYTTRSGFTTPNRRPDHRPDWYQPVREATDRVNVSHMAQERQDRQTENELQHKLGMQLIDIGYKALAAKLHPDKGGSREAMQRLNRVRDILKGAI